MNDSELIQAAIKKFAELPGVGPKQATRFVFYLFDLTKANRSEFINSLKCLDIMKRCNQCGFPTSGSLCEFCANPDRNKNLICVVERATDLLNIEKSNTYQGIYHLISSTLKPENKKTAIQLLKSRITQLIKETPADQIEVIIATNQTTEGEALALLVEQNLKPLKVKISRLARGLPTGAELEYTDIQTLKGAFENRKSA